MGPLIHEREAMLTALLPLDLARHACQCQHARDMPYIPTQCRVYQRTYDAFSNAKSTDDASVSDEECTEEIKTILHDFIENCKREQREERYLTEQFCLSMIQPFVPTQLKRKNPLYLA